MAFGDGVVLEGGLVVVVVVVVVEVVGVDDEELEDPIELVPVVPPEMGVVEGSPDVAEGIAGRLGIETPKGAVRPAMPLITVGIRAVMLVGFGIGVTSLVNSMAGWPCDTEAWEAKVSAVSAAVGVGLFPVHKLMTPGAVVATAGAALDGTGDAAGATSC